MSVDLLRSLEQAFGVLLMLAVLLDVFLTVLYARIGTSIIANRLARLTWWSFLKISAPCCRMQGAILSFCGPTILVLVVALWVSGLALGAAMIFHPELGSAIRASNALARLSTAP